MVHAGITNTYYTATGVFASNNNIKIASTQLTVATKQHKQIQQLQSATQIQQLNVAHQLQVYTLYFIIRKIALYTWCLSLKYTAGSTIVE